MHRVFRELAFYLGGSGIDEVLLERDEGDQPAERIQAGPLSRQKKKQMRNIVEYANRKGFCLNAPFKKEEE